MNPTVRGFLMIGVIALVIVVLRLEATLTALFLLARRIVFNPKAGDRLERGQRVGMIKFGSRVDVVLDASARVNVKIGDHVKGGSTILAYLQPRETASAGSVSATQKAH